MNKNEIFYFQKQIEEILNNSQKYSTEICAEHLF